MSESNGILPKGWTNATLLETGQWHGGGTPSKAVDAYWHNGSVPWISPKDMKAFRLADSEDHITPGAVNNGNAQLFPKGTVLVVIRSGILARTLPVAISEVPATMNQDLKGIQPHNGIDSSYLAYFLVGNEHDVLKKCSKHGTTVASIDTHALHNYQICLPPTNEQRRIVAKIEELFSDLDAGVAALQRVRANLKRYRASLLKAAVEGKLTAAWRAEQRDVEPAPVLLERILTDRRRRWEADQRAKYAAGKPLPKNWQAKYAEPKPPDTTGLPELPQGWCWATVEQLVSRSEYGTSVKCSHTGKGVPVLRIPNIVGGTVDLADLKYTNEEFALAPDDGLQVGDLLMCRTNGSVSLIGKCAVVKSNYAPTHSFASYLLRFRFCEVSAIPNWIHVFATSIHGRLFIEKHAASSAGQHNISLSLMHGMPLPLPPLAEQQQMVAEVEERLSILSATEAAVERDLQRAARLRQSILKRAFAGQLVPQDPNDEPAAVLLERLRARWAQETTGMPSTVDRTRGNAANKRRIK